MTTTSTTDLSTFTSDLFLGTGVNGGHADPALARLSTGGFVAVWQGADTVAGGAGAGVWAQVRDASGNALGAAFAITANGDARIEGQAFVTALANGRFVVAYDVSSGGADSVAYRVIEADGTVGAEHVLGYAGYGETTMPSVTALADGSFAVAWKSAGAIHVQQADAFGTTLGAVQDYAALGSAFSPTIAGLAAGGYVVSWGEMNDGNVYGATSAGQVPFVVSGDGYAASVSTAAPLSHVTALAGGGFVVTWDSYLHETHGFTISDIFFQRYDNAGHALGPVAQANVDSSGGLYDAAVTATADGGFAIAWQGSDGDGFGIYGRRFGADGTAIDDREFQINQQSKGDQSAPDIVALGTGFAAAWTDTAASGAVSAEVRVLVGSTDPTATGGTVGSTAGSVAQSVGTTADDLLRISAGTGVLDGHAGRDTVVVSGVRAGATITLGDSGYLLSDAAGDHVSLLNVERVQFNDEMVALDVNGKAGEAYRLYQAAFDRVPDKAGLGYWISVLDSGVSLEQAASGFSGSKEFADLYGANTTDSQFVQALYQNVLHRPLDAAGYDFWINSLHAVSRGAVLADFSESAENQAQVIGSIQNGIEYLHWG